MPGSEPLDRLSGSLVDGRYRVEQPVGAGGCGTVYSAFHVGLGARVALKVLSLPERLRPEQRATLVGAFFEEARTLKRLRHPGIVAALDVGLLPPDERGAQRPYLVMEWCDGPTLKQALERRGGRPMGLGQAWRLFEPLLDAVAHAHAAGVAHRDLKPANVILEERGEGAVVPRVIDFGIAKIVAPDEQAGSGETRTTSGSSPFTLRYAAPEQLAGARTGPWTDVHALALLFVEMVIGRPAIGADGDARLAAIDPVRPTPKALGVDVGAVEGVLARALAIRPADRHPDAGALAAAMRALAAAGWPEAPAADDPEPLDMAVAAPARATAREVELTTAPPSDTAGTSRDTHAAPAPGRPGARRLGAFVAAATLALGAAAAAARWQGGWPFSAARLRDLADGELDRRMAAAGLGACTSSSVGGWHTVHCERGKLIVFPTAVALSTPRQDVREFVSSFAAEAGRREERAAWFAVDADRALVLLAPADRIAAAFERVLGGAAAEVRAAAGEPPRR